MTTATQCPACDRQVAPDAPDGLCPSCLIKGALTNELGHSLTDSRPTSTMRVPQVAEVAALLPHLDVAEELGRGGMGVVYLARQPGLDRPVAVKILPREIGEDPAFAERFAREARSLAKLSHPNIVAVHDSGYAGDYCYFIMEYVDGSNLRGLLASKAITPREALELIPQICAGLQYAHETGIVHRDIKPENILVTEDGRVKIADFGLAKLLGPDSKDATITLTNQVMGTPHYMAPEQLRLGSGAVDHRADIYALGVVLYELLTGQLPIGRFAPPSKVAKSDPALDGIVLRCLESNPERRFQHVQDVQDALERGESLPVPVHAAETVAVPRSPEEEREEVLRMLDAREARGEWTFGHYVAAVPTLGLAPALRAETLLRDHLAENDHAVAKGRADEPDELQQRRARYRDGAIERSVANSRRRSRGILIWLFVCGLVAVGGLVGSVNNPEPRKIMKTRSVYELVKVQRLVNGQESSTWEQRPVQKRYPTSNLAHRDWREKMVVVSATGGVLWLLGLLAFQLLHWRGVRSHERNQLYVDVLDRELSVQRTEQALAGHDLRWRINGWKTVAITVVALAFSIASVGILAIGFFAWLVYAYGLTVRHHTEAEERGLTAS